MQVVANKTRTSYFKATMSHHTNMKRFTQHCCIATLYFHEVVALENRIKFGTTES